MLAVYDRTASPLFLAFITIYSLRRSTCSLLLTPHASSLATPPVIVLRKHGCVVSLRP